MLKLFYVNNISKKANSARSRQVSENEFALRHALGEGFISFFPDDLFLINKILNENNAFRKIIFHLRLILKLMFLNSAYTIYSRNLSVLLLGSFFGFNIVWEAHDLPKGKNLKLLSKIKSKLRIVSISDALKRALVDQFKVDSVRILTAHDAVSVELYDEYRLIQSSETRKTYKLPLDKKIILHSGSIMKERGSSLFNIVLQALDDNWVFVQVGGSEQDGIRIKAELLHTDRFIFIPHQGIEELVKLQLCSDALFYMITKDTSTYWCCSPMKIFEFLASGKPIVASNIGSLSEIIDEEVAFVFNPDELSSLEAALNKLADLEQSKEIASKALQRVRDEYTWKIRANNIRQFIFQ